MNWLFNKRISTTEPQPQPQPQPPQKTMTNDPDEEMFILIDVVNDDGNKVPTIEPISLIDCLSIYTSYMDTNPATATTMPITPSNTPTGSPKSTSAFIYDNKHTLWESPPSELDILAGLTNASSFSSLIFTPDEPVTTIEDIDYTTSNIFPCVTPTMSTNNNKPIYCTSLTPMLLHGGIPITFMLMAQLGIGTPMEKR